MDAQSPSVCHIMDARNPSVCHMMDARTLAAARLHDGGRHRRVRRRHRLLGDGAQGAQETLEAAGYHVLVVNTERAGARERAAPLRAGPARRGAAQSPGRSRSAAARAPSVVRLRRLSRLDIGGPGWNPSHWPESIPVAGAWGRWGEEKDGTTDRDRRDRPGLDGACLLYTSPSPRDLSTSRMPSSA